MIPIGVCVGPDNVAVNATVRGVTPSTSHKTISAPKEILGKESCTKISILSTEEKTSEMIPVLTQFFSDFNLEINHIGETQVEKIIFSQNSMLDFKEFKKNFVRVLEQEFEKVKI